MIRTILLTATLFVAAILQAGGCTPSKADNSKEELMAKLKSAAERGSFFFGHQDGILYGKHWNIPDSTPAQDIKEWKSDVKEVCGDYPAVLGVDMGKIEMDSLKNLDQNRFDIIREAVRFYHKAGGIVTVSWHPMNPLTGGNTWDNTKDSVIRYILPGHPGNAKFLSWLDKVSAFLLSLTDENGRQIPVIFRPFHENSGKWFWWGVQDSSPEEYKALYQMTHKYITDKGLKNLVWSYSPNTGADSAIFMKYYPGDEYVDLLGWDAYQFGEGIGPAFRDQLSSDIKMVAKIAKERNKLMALTETGYESIPDAKWWTGVVLEAVKGSPVSYVLVWRNAWNRDTHYYAPYKGQTSAPDFIEFYKSPATIFLRDIK
jgi:hypothetical protein